jgi:hypothetical protein
MTSKAYKIGWWLLMIFNLIGLLNSIGLLVEIVVVYITLTALTSPFAEFWMNNSGLIIFPFLISLVVFISFYFSIKARFADKKFLKLALGTSVLSMVLINVFNFSFINSVSPTPFQLSIFGYVLVVIFVISVILLLIGVRASSPLIATLGMKSKWFLTIFCIFPLIIAIASTVFCFYDLLTNDYGYGSVSYKVGKPVLVFDLAKRTSGQMISGLAVDYESSPIKVIQTIIDKKGGNNIILAQTYNQGANVDNEINKLLEKYQYSEIFLAKLNKKAYLTVPTTENKNEIIIFNNNEVLVMIISQIPLDETSANQLMDKLIEK